jgi:hypothetical protein
MSLPSSSSFSSFCGAGGIPPNSLQPTETYCANPALVPRSSPEALNVKLRERPLSAKGGIMGEKWQGKFSLTMRFPRHCRVLLHAVNLRHGTDGFTSPSKEGMLRIGVSTFWNPQGLKKVWTGIAKPYVSLYFRGFLSLFRPIWGPECSRRLRLRDFKTIGTWRCKVVSPTHRPPSLPGNIPGTHFCKRLIRY